MDYFSENLGFGEYKSRAIELLKITIDILNEFDINHMLISGTLLGYVRHNDFIPWDDDIDILVDNSILKKLGKIVDKYPNINLFFRSKYDSIKICFKDGEVIPNSTWDNDIVTNDIIHERKYTFPFVDMFIYELGPGAHICGGYGKLNKGNKKVTIFLPFSGLCDRCFRFLDENQMVFFHNYWKKKDFFPLRQVYFNGIKCNIPNNYHHFLKKNYGKEYMDTIESPEFNHKTNLKNKDIIKSNYVRK